jgi:hypothetical protein
MARAQFCTAIDSENILGQLFNFKAIPNVVLIDPSGVIRYIRRGFDIRKPEFAKIVENWAYGDSELDDQLDHKDTTVTTEAMQYFREGLALYQNNEPEEALVAWRRGVAIEPDNYIIRKQIWAVENPDRFYDGPVDFSWQKEQLDNGR